jgi:hypothetical protein
MSFFLKWQPKQLLGAMTAAAIGLVLYRGPLTEAQADPLPPQKTEVKRRLTANGEGVEYIVKTFDRAEPSPVVEAHYIYSRKTDKLEIQVFDHSGLPNNFVWTCDLQNGTLTGTIQVPHVETNYHCQLPFRQENIEACQSILSLMPSQLQAIYQTSSQVVGIGGQYRDELKAMQGFLSLLQQLQKKAEGWKP